MVKAKEEEVIEEVVVDNTKEELLTLLDKLNSMNIRSISDLEVMIANL